MKKLILTAIVAIAAISIQAQDLPKPSPHGEVEAVVGVTEIEIDYSRPGVKDRVIFGELLPFGELWRFGANAATKFSTEHDLFFDEGILSAGEYSVLAIPDETKWQIIFSTDLEVSEQSYSEEFDALRLTAEPQENSFTETLTLGVNDVRHASASFEMLWENTKISIPFIVKTDELAVENIEEAIQKGEDLGSVYQNAANYYFGSVKDYDTALKYVNSSLRYGEDYRNLFLKARILKLNGEDEEAYGLANTALKHAEESASQGYQNFIEGTLESWNK